MTSNSRWKNKVRAHAADNGLTYQQAHDALTAQAEAGAGFTADPARWTGIGAGRYLIDFNDEHGLGGHEIEPFRLDVAGAEDLREQLGAFAMGRGWFGFYVEFNGLAGRVRLDIEPGNADLLGTFTLRPDPDVECPVDLPSSFSHEMYELIDAVQTRFDCTVDAFTFVRGAHGGEVEYVGLIYQAGTQMYHLLHIADHPNGWQYTLSGGWPLARDEEAVEAFQAKVAEHIHA
jgi:hypothetical protein